MACNHPEGSLYHHPGGIVCMACGEPVEAADIMLEVAP